MIVIENRENPFKGQIIYIIYTDELIKFSGGCFYVIVYLYNENIMFSVDPKRCLIELL